MLETAECRRPHPASLRPVGHFQLIEHVWTARIGAAGLAALVVIVVGVVVPGVGGGAAMANGKQRKRKFFISFSINFATK